MFKKLLISYSLSVNLLLIVAFADQYQAKNSYGSNENSIGRDQYQLPARPGLDHYDKGPQHEQQQYQQQDDYEAINNDDRPKIRFGFRLRMPAVRFDLPRVNLPKITVSAKIQQPQAVRTIRLPEINLDTSSHVSSSVGASNLNGPNPGGLEIKNSIRSEPHVEEHPPLNQRQNQYQAAASESNPQHQHYQHSQQQQPQKFSQLIQYNHQFNRPANPYNNYQMDEQVPAMVLNLAGTSLNPIYSGHPSNWQQQQEQTIFSNSASRLQNQYITSGSEIYPSAQESPSIEQTQSIQPSPGSPDQPKSNRSLRARLRNLLG